MVNFFSLTLDIFTQYILIYLIFENVYLCTIVCIYYNLFKQKFIF